MKLRRAVEQDRDAVIDVGERLLPYGFDSYDAPPEEVTPRLRSEPLAAQPYAPRHFAR